MFASLLGQLMSNLLYFALHLSSSSSFPPPLSASKEREYLERMKNGDDSAADILIEHNLRLVAHIIKKYYASFSDQEDLISIGTIGLIKGIRTFDAEKGTRLATYAARCIENEILMHFRSQRKSAQDVSMSDPIDIDSEGNPLTLSDIIYTNDTIADDLDMKLKSEQLRQYVDELTDSRERMIIILRYGLANDMPLTQREVAKKLDISRSYVSQRGYCKRRRESVDGQGFLRSCIEKDRSALIVSVGKIHKIKSGCLLNTTGIRTSKIEARAI